MKRNIFWLTAILMAFTACKKEANQLGLNIQPQSDQIDVMFNDTSSIVAYSELIDSITSSNTPVSIAGSLHDPVMGTSTAAFSAMLRLSRIAFSFGDNPQVDSLILTLDYVGLYGDSLSEVTLRVYELTEPLVSDTTYYSNSHIAYSDLLLAETTFVPNTTDSLFIGGDTLAPHLRINMTSLTDALAQKLISATEEQMSSNVAFHEFFNGLRVEGVPVTSSGQLISFDLLSSLSEMVIYYSNDEDDSLSYGYTINSNSVRASNFTHDYTTADSRFKEQVVNGDTTLGQELNYIQPMGGVTTRIFFPNITHWYDDGPVVVNEARIFLEGFETDPYIKPPLSILLVRPNDDGVLVPLLEQLEGIDYFGGTYDQENNRYWFRVTSYVQELMKGSIEDRGLSVVINGAAYTARRFVMVGPEPGSSVDPEKRMRLELKYTSLNNITGP